MVAIFQAPCDEQVIAHKEPTRPVPCPRDVGRAVLIATILASSMVFIDGSAVNVALLMSRISNAAPAHSQKQMRKSSMPRQAASCCIECLSVQSC
jgi:hypothetical protein